MAAVLKMQKPWVGAVRALPANPAWWPGGLAAMSAVSLLSKTSAMAETARVAASQVPCDM